MRRPSLSSLSLLQDRARSAPPESQRQSTRGRSRRDVTASLSRGRRALLHLARFEGTLRARAPTRRLASRALIATSCARVRSLTSSYAATSFVAAVSSSGWWVLASIKRPDASAYFSSRISMSAKSVSRRHLCRAESVSHRRVCSFVSSARATWFSPFRTCSLASSRSPSSPDCDEPSPLEITTRSATTMSRPAVRFCANKYECPSRSGATLLGRLSLRSCRKRSRHPGDRRHFEQQSLVRSNPSL